MSDEELVRDADDKYPSFREQLREAWETRLRDEVRNVPILLLIALALVLAFLLLKPQIVAWIDSNVVY